MNHTLHAVFETLPDGSHKLLYGGPDSVKAEAAMAQSVSEGKAEAVRKFLHMQSTSIRYPAQEKAQAADRADAARRQLQADVDRKSAEAAEKRAKAKELTAEAKKLEAEAAAHLQTK